MGYLFPPVVAYRALMYTEFHNSAFTIHIWDNKGAFMELKGDEILQYVSNAFTALIIHYSSSNYYYSYHYH